VHVLTEQVSGRQANLLTAEVVRGTCPDMCPEKERYMREDRRRLSVYEMVHGTDLVCASVSVTVPRASHVHGTWHHLLCNLRRVFLLGTAIQFGMDTVD